MAFTISTFYHAWVCQSIGQDKWVFLALIAVVFVFVRMAVVGRVVDQP